MADDPQTDEPDLEQLHRAYQSLASNPKEAVFELQELAAQGSTLSMLYLGHAHQNGIGGPVDLSKAEEFYRRAAERGSLPSSYQLGRMYFDTEKYLQAKDAFEIGAEGAYMPSLQMLGRMYMYGIGVNKDLEMAKDLFERASKKGHVFAKRNLAIILMTEKFNIVNLIRGAWLFAVSLLNVVTLVATDRLSDRLR
jgi:TPR repeat protein